MCGRNLRRFGGRLAEKFYCDCAGTNTCSAGTARPDEETCLQAADFDRNISLCVVADSLKMQEDYLRAKQKHGKGKTVAIPKPAVRANICRLFGISAPTYGKIMIAYLTNRQIYVSGKFDNGRSGNMAQRDTRRRRWKIRFANGSASDDHNEFGLLQGKCWIFWLISGSLLFQEIIAQVGMKEMGYYQGSEASNVGRQCSISTTLEIVYQRLMEEFQSLEYNGGDAIIKMIEKCALIARRFYEQMDEDDAGDDGEDPADDSEGDETDDDAETPLNDDQPLPDTPVGNVNEFQFETPEGIGPLGPLTAD